MRYQVIVDWIDSELERLGNARRLLAPEELTVPYDLPKAAEPQPVLAKAATEKVVEVRIVPPRRRYTPRARRGSRTTQSLEPTALSGSVPTGPVAVSRMAAEANRRERIVAAALPEQITPPAGTLEALLRELGSRTGH